MLNTSRARALRRSQTDAERKLWRCLRDRQAGSYKFRRQHPIGPYITDFCCIERHLIVEIDGSQHSAQIKSDARRTRYLESQGYRVLRFWADAAVRETQAVTETILNKIKNCPHPSARHPLPKGEGI